MQAVEEEGLNLENEIAPLDAGDFEALPGDTSTYEIGYHLLPTLDDEEVAKAVADLHKDIEKKNGSIITEDAPKKITLAYMMDKVMAGKHERFTQAYFGWVKVEMYAADAAALGEVLHAEKNILRYFMARTVKEDTLLAGKQFLRSELKDKEKKMAPVAAVESAVEKAPLSEEELDRSLEKLIAD